MNATHPTTPQPRSWRLPEIVKAAARELDGVAIALNSVSKTKRCPFHRPGRVWDGLLFLDTVARDHYLGRALCPNLDHAAREYCGARWGGTSKTVQRRFATEYTTWFEGRRLRIPEHLKWGTGRNPRTLLRLAFTWHAERQIFVVSYIGPHQRNLMT